MARANAYVFSTLEIGSVHMVPCISMVAQRLARYPGIQGIGSSGVGNLCGCLGPFCSVRPMYRCAKDCGFSPGPSDVWDPCDLRFQEKLCQHAGAKNCCVTCSCRGDRTSQLSARTLEAAPPRLPWSHYHGAGGASLEESRTRCLQGAGCDAQLERLLSLVRGDGLLTITGGGQIGQARGTQPERPDKLSFAFQGNFNTLAVGNAFLLRSSQRPASGTECAPTEAQGLDMGPRWVTMAQLRVSLKKMQICVKAPISPHRAVTDRC